MQVNGFLETSNRASYIVGLGTGSIDPAMPGKIMDFAQQHQPDVSLASAKRAVTLIGVRKATRERLAPGIAQWLGVAQ